MKRKGEKEVSALPVYKYSLLILVIFLAISCRTEEPVIITDTSKEATEDGSGGDSGELVESPEGLEESGPGELGWLDKAEIAWFEHDDPQLTDYCLDRVGQEELVDSSSRALYQLLCRKVYTRVLPLTEKGFTDRNISSLFLDGDDLWLGTWTGGVGRYSLPLDELTILRESRESLRVEKISDFEPQNGRIRLAGYSDLYTYEKRTSLFEQHYPEDMDRINNLAYYQGTLYASTVSKGLWYEGEGGGWYRVGKNISGLDRINTLYEDNRGHLLIGTASGGIFDYDGETFANLKNRFPHFDGRNVTSLDETGDLIIVGTYGEGGYILNWAKGVVTHYSKDKGDFLSDYLLCVLAGEKWLFAGTLGGGLYALEKDRLGENPKWVPLGMDEGLSSLDTAALVHYDNSLYVSVLGQGVLIIDEEIIEKTL